MARSWIVDGRGIAKKIKTSNLPLVHQIKDCGAKRECPKCNFKIDNSDVAVEWPGLPIGVKFEPNDIEILEHLAAKCGVGNEMPHQFIDEFIPTLDVDEGICYKHPENLPGKQSTYDVTNSDVARDGNVVGSDGLDDKSKEVLFNGARKDGNSVHFFYRITNAYTTGQRKRRKISHESSLTRDVRWHKTGKTKAVMKNGVQIGWKKIMVLYRAAVGGSKPHKLNWVMHQYHLGTVEDEKEGQYVVAKIFYQSQKEIEKVDNHDVTEKLDAWMGLTSPRTPNTIAPDPRRAGKSVFCDDITTDNVCQSPPQESEHCVEQKYLPSSSKAKGENKDKMELPVWEDDSQAVDLDAFDDSLFCKENLDSNYPVADSRFDNEPQSASTNVKADCAPGTSRGASFGVDDLENLDLGTPPDFSLTDLQFSSQDSIFGWLERL